MENIKDVEPPSRLEQLDGLRGLAISGVLLNHFVPIPWTLWCGWAGVSLFFVLSGFLITRILLMQKSLILEGASTPGHALFTFYARRALRIFPLYYAVVMALVFFDYRNSRAVAVPLTTYTYNFYSSIGGLPHLWSLSVEEQFYLVWPFLILLFPRKSLPWLVALTFCCGPIWRFYCMLSGTNRLPLYLHTIACLDCLAAGSFLAWIASLKNPVHFMAFTKKLKIPGYSCLILWAVFCLLPRQVIWKNVPVQWVFGNTALAIFFTYAIAKANAGWNGWFGVLLHNSMLRYVGTVSYGVYVLHLFIPLLWTTIMPRGWDPHFIVRSAFMILLSITVGAFSWHLFESPIQSFKFHFPYKIRRKSNTGSIDPPDICHAA